MTYTATLCLEVVATSPVTTTVRRAFVACGNGDGGRLDRQTQYLAGNKVFVAVGGITHTGNTHQQAHDAALAMVVAYPWIARLLDPADADQVLAAAARHRQRRGG